MVIRRKNNCCTESSLDKMTIIYDATGARMRTLPMTSERVKAALQAV